METELSHIHNVDEQDKEELSLVHSPPRTITLFGDIEESVAGEVIHQLYSLDEEDTISGNSKPIKLILSSCGGDVMDMFAIYDTIQFLKQKRVIEAYAVGKVMSAAVLLLAGCSRGHRFVGKNCRLMVHSVQGGTYGSLADLDINTKELKKVKELYINELLDNSTLTKKRLTYLLKGIDKYFDAEEAIQWGIADVVL